MNYFRDLQFVDLWRIQQIENENKISISIDRDFVKPTIIPAGDFTFASLHIDTYVIYISPNYGYTYEIEVHGPRNVGPRNRMYFDMIKGRHFYVSPNIVDTILSISNLC